MSNNCEYASYQQWVEAMAEDPNMTAEDIGIAIKGVHYEDASTKELQEMCGAGKRAVIASKKKLQQRKYVKVKPGGHGQGNRSIILPRMPDGRVVAFDSDIELVMKNKAEKSGKELPDSLYPDSVPLVSPLCPDRGANLHPITPPNKYINNPPIAGRSEFADGSSNTDRSKNNLASNARAPNENLKQLNGHTSHYVEMLAGWINPLLPNHAEAENFLQSMIGSYGAEIVKKAMTDTHASKVKGDIITSPVKFLLGACKSLEENKKKKKAQKRFYHDDGVYRG